jgi:antitoxin component YwqK of YwqJK toxin-antitoxin module
MLYHGRYIRYNPDGQKNYVREFVEGLAQGEHVGYHANGKTKEKGRFEGGLEAGEWRTFDEAERLLTTVFYEKGEAVWRVSRSYHPDGRLAADGPRKIKNPASSMLDVDDGPFIEYYENGGVSRRGQYRAGQAIGTWEDRARDGRLVQQRIFSDPPDNERFVKVTIYDATGAIEESGYQTRMGRKHGEWIETVGGAQVHILYEQGRVVRR